MTPVTQTSVERHGRESAARAGAMHGISRETVRQWKVVAARAPERAPAHPIARDPDEVPCWATFHFFRPASGPPSG